MNMTQFIYVQMFRWNDEVQRHFEFWQTSVNSGVVCIRKTILTRLLRNKNMLKGRGCKYVHFYNPDSETVRRLDYFQFLLNK